MILVQFCLLNPNTVTKMVNSKVKGSTIAFRYAERRKTDKNLHFQAKFQPPIKYFGQKTFKNSLQWPFFMLEKNLSSIDCFYEKTLFYMVYTLNTGLSQGPQEILRKNISIFWILWFLVFHLYSNVYCNTECLSFDNIRQRNIIKSSFFKYIAITAKIFKRITVFVKYYLSNSIWSLLKSTVTPTSKNSFGTIRVWGDPYVI